MEKLWTLFHGKPAIGPMPPPPSFVEIGCFFPTGLSARCALFEWKKDRLEKIYENKNLSTHMNHAILVDDVLFTALMAMYTWQAQRIWFALNSLPEK